MAAHPEIQRRAQAELDRIIGIDRLPNFGDYDLLDYIKAITLESMRWMPVLPIGVAHSVIADDEYKGYHIPSGTTIIAASLTLS